MISEGKSVSYAKNRAPIYAQFAGKGKSEAYMASYAKAILEKKSETYARIYAQAIADGKSEEHARDNAQRKETDRVREQARIEREKKQAEEKKRAEERQKERVKETFYNLAYKYKRGLGASHSYAVVYATSYAVYRVEGKENHYAASYLADKKASEYFSR